jgi:predicted DNA-binding transcriptional regulator YafY
MQPAGKLFNEKVPNTLALLFKSIAEKTQIILFYKAVEALEVVERTIEPVGIFHDHDNWYTFGYCHLRQDYRQFRTDRIHEIKTTDLPFTKEHEALETYLQNGKDKVPTTRVKILVDPKIAKHLDGEKKYHGFVAERRVGDHIEMTFNCTDLEEGFSRWYLMFGDYAIIVEPESLKISVLTLMEKIQSRMKVNLSGIKELV